MPACAAASRTSASDMRVRPHTFKTVQNANCLLPYLKSRAARVQRASCLISLYYLRRQHQETAYTAPARSAARRYGTCLLRQRSAACGGAGGRHYCAATLKARALRNAADAVPTHALAKTTGRAACTLLAGRPTHHTFSTSYNTWPGMTLPAASAAGSQGAVSARPRDVPISARIHCYALQITPPKTFSAWRHYTRQTLTFRHTFTHTARTRHLAWRLLRTPRLSACRG